MISLLLIKNLERFLCTKLEKAHQLFCGVLCRTITIIYFLLESLFMILQRRKLEILFFLLILVGFSCAILFIKRKIKKHANLMITVIYASEFSAFLELAFLEHNVDWDSKGIPTRKYFAIFFLITTQLAIPLPMISEFFLKCFYIFYFIIRMSGRLEMPDTVAISFSLLFIILRFMSCTKSLINLKVNNEKIRKLQKEASLGVLIRKNYRNCLIIDPLLMVANPDLVYLSLMPIFKDSSLKGDDSPVSPISKKGRSSDIFHADSGTIKSFFSDFKIDQTNPEKYNEKDLYFEQLVLKISVEVLAFKEITNEAQSVKEVVRGKGTLKNTGKIAQRGRAVNFVIYSFFEESDSKKPQLFIIIKDETLKNEVKDLRSLDAFKDRLLATVVHDVRAPLSLISSLIEIALTCETFEEIKKNLKTCEANVKFLEYLVSDILDYSLFKEGRLNLSCSYFPIQSTLEQCMCLIKLPAEFKNIELKIICKISSEDPFYTDQRRLKQVIINLLTNALKFTRAGSITLEAELDGHNPNYVVIRVIDTGSGIKSENIQLLGSPFTTFDIAEGVNKNGIGLGLFISKTIIGQLGPFPNFVITSEEDKGSTFSFTLFRDIRKGKMSSALLLGYEMNPSLKVSSHSSQKIHKSNLEILRSIKSKGTEDLNSLEIDDKTLFFKALKKQKTLPLKDNPFFGQRSSSIEKINSNESEIDITHRPKTNNLVVLSEDFICEQDSQPELKSREILHVLIVDDNIFNILVLETLLKKAWKEGLQIEKACDGAQAIEVFKSFNKAGSKNPIHFIFMDCLMPVMDGREATRQIKDLINNNFNNSCEDAFIVGLTAFHLTEIEKQDCFMSGMDLIFQKPVTEQTLKELLKNNFS